MAHNSRQAGTADTTFIDDYTTGPTNSGQFASVVERNVIFEADSTLYQVRIQRSAQHDYALLNRWSAHKEDWSIVAKRRPSEYGIAAFYPARFDSAAFDEVIEELIDMAYLFESAYTTQREADTAIGK